MPDQQNAHEPRRGAATARPRVQYAAHSTDEADMRRQHAEAVDSAVRSAYTLSAAHSQEAGHTGDWISLTEIRTRIDREQHRLGGQPFDRADVDAALQRLTNDNTHGKVHLIPNDAQHNLTADDHHAAVRFGDTDRHLMWIDPDPELTYTTDPDEAFHGHRRTDLDVDVDAQATERRADSDNTARGGDELRAQPPAEHTTDRVARVDRDSAAQVDPAGAAARDTVTEHDTASTTPVDVQASTPMQPATAQPDLTHDAEHTEYGAGREHSRRPTESGTARHEATAPGKAPAAAAEATDQPAAVTAAETNLAVCRAERTIAQLRTADHDQDRQAATDYDDQIATWRADDHTATSTATSTSTSQTQ